MRISSHSHLKLYSHSAKFRVLRETKSNTGIKSSGVESPAFSKQKDRNRTICCYIPSSDGDFYFSRLRARGNLSSTK